MPEESRQTERLSKRQCPSTTADAKTTGEMLASYTKVMTDWPRTTNGPGPWSCEIQNSACKLLVEDSERCAEEHTRPGTIIVQKETPIVHPSVSSSGSGPERSRSVKSFTRSQTIPSSSPCRRPPLTVLIPKPDPPRPPPLLISGRAASGNTSSSSASGVSGRPKQPPALLSTEPSTSILWTTATDMAGQGPSLTSQARAAELSAAAKARLMNSNLYNQSNLSPAQSVPLGTLSRVHLRNRVSGHFVDEQSEAATVFQRPRRPIDRLFPLSNDLPSSKLPAYAISNGAAMQQMGQSYYGSPGKCSYGAVNAHEHLPGHLQEQLSMASDAEKSQFQFVRQDRFSPMHANSQPNANPMPSEINGASLKYATMSAVSGSRPLHMNQGQAHDGLSVLTDARYTQFQKEGFLPQTPNDKRQPTNAAPIPRALERKNNTVAAMSTRPTTKESVQSLSSSSGLLPTYLNGEHKAGRLNTGSKKQDVAAYLKNVTKGESTILQQGVLEDPFAPESADGKKDATTMPTTEEHGVFTSLASRLHALARVNPEVTYREFQRGLNGLRQPRYVPEIARLAAAEQETTQGPRAPPGLSYPAPRRPVWQTWNINVGELTCKRLISADQWYHRQ